MHLIQKIKKNDIQKETQVKSQKRTINTSDENMAIYVRKHTKNLLNGTFLIKIFLQEIAELKKVDLDR